MKNRSAFTIVELLIAVSIIVILSGIAVFAYTGIQKDARDSVRKGNSITLSEALEKYYEANGEYPSVASLVNSNPANTGEAIANKLNISVNDLKMPRMPSGVTNSLIDGESPHDDLIAYVAESDTDNTRCQNDVNGGCDQYSLKYVEESGETKTIESRRRTRTDGSGGAPLGPGGGLPLLSPSLAVGSSGGNVNVIAGRSTCDTGYTRTFTYTYRTKGGNDSTETPWAAYSAPSTGNTFSQPGVEGTTYEFKALATCDNGAGDVKTSPEGASNPYIYPVEAPPSPTVTMVDNGNGTVTGTSADRTCTAAGATIQYSFRSRVNEGAYTAWSAWSATKSLTVPMGAGESVGIMAKVRCVMTNAISLESFGPVATMSGSISTPAAPVQTVTTSGNNSTFSWNATSCPSGYTAEYQTRRTIDSGYDSGWQTYTGVTSFVWNTSSQGYKYTQQIKTRCVGAVNSEWSSVNTATYTRLVCTPPAPSGFTNPVVTKSITGSNIPGAYNPYGYIKYTWTPSACGPGLDRMDISGNIYATGPSGDPYSWRWKPYDGTGWSPGNGETMSIDPWYVNTPYPATNMTFETVGQYLSPAPKNGTAKIGLQIRFGNSTTGRWGSYSPVGISPTYTVP